MVTDKHGIPFHKGLDIQQQSGCFDIQQAAAELKLRAERKLGEMLKEQEKHPPGPDRAHDVTDTDDLG